MKSRRRRAKRLRVLHLWTLPEVQKAVPYLHSVVSSLREHWLEVLHLKRKSELAGKQRQPDRRANLVLKQDLQEERGRAQRKFDEALDELNDIDVFLLDAVQGLALIPFRKEDDLAWFVFDHFAEAGLVGWRYHNDPFEECRSLRLLPKAVLNSSPPE
jgi:hypothetical protein